MEMLNRNTYEIWFLDYLDGQLNEEQLNVLLDFVEQNPDLKQELQNIKGITLLSGDELLDRKDTLLKSGNDIPGIAAIDQLCIARMENDLTAEEAARFDSRRSEDRKLEENYQAFNLTRLAPATAVIYPDKNTLRKKTVFFSPWVITAISSAAIILLAWVLWPTSPEKSSPVVAKVETPTTKVDSVNQPATRNPQPITHNPQPATLTLQPATRHPQPEKSIPARESVSMNALVPRILAGPRIPDAVSGKILYASNHAYPVLKSLPTAEEALTLPQYALQLFREKVLGEDRTLVRKTRFSMWEVAGAGVNKINSIAGTNMELNRQYDDQGDLLAVSFNSRLVDVEAPVRAK